MPRRYVVVGTGAVGGLYGARLAAAGHEVAFLARTDAAHLTAQGLRVDSVNGDVVLPPGSFRVASDPADLEPPDVVMVALKTTANGAFPSLLPPLVEPATVVAVFQNGLGVEAAAAAAAPGVAAVVGGMCFVCAARVGPGHIRHEDYGAVTVGAHAGAPDAAVAIAADLAEAGVRAEVLPDLTTGRWRKLLWNVPFNGLSVVLDAGTDELLADASSRALAVDLMAEVVSGGQACGAVIGPGDAELMVTSTEQMVPYRTSMKLDFDAGRPLEHDAIHGAPVRAAAAAGVAMPRVEALWLQLAFLDSQNRRRKLPV